MLEIERKFHIKDTSFKQLASKKIRIVQAYLNSDPERSVRVRITNQKGFLTIKGKANDQGTSRFEWEKEIPIIEAEALLKICEAGKIEKNRYLVPNGEHTFEVDEFFNENEGLIVAEIELKSENEAFQKPNWLGKEVTGIKKYYNSSLLKKPFKSW